MPETQTLLSATSLLGHALQVFWKKLSSAKSRFSPGFSRLSLPYSVLFHTQPFLFPLSGSGFVESAVQGPRNSSKKRETGLLFTSLPPRLLYSPGQRAVTKRALVEEERPRDKSRQRIPKSEKERKNTERKRGGLTNTHTRCRKSACVQGLRPSVPTTAEQMECFT